MVRMYVNTKVRLQKSLEQRFAGTDREAGQGMLEYVGILVIAALLIGAVMAALKVIDPTELVGEKAKEISDALNGKGS